MVGLHVYRHIGRNYGARFATPTKLHVVTTNQITIYKNGHIRSVIRQTRGGQILKTPGHRGEQTILLRRLTFVGLGHGICFLSPAWGQ